MIVIADASPLNYLVLIEEAEILARLYGQVVIPLAVFSRLMKNGSRLPFLAERRT